jgi:hypothetical protein
MTEMVEFTEKGMWFRVPRTHWLLDCLSDSTEVQMK